MNRYLLRICGLFPFLVEIKDKTFLRIFVNFVTVVILESYVQENIPLSL